MWYGCLHEGQQERVKLPYMSGGCVGNCSHFMRIYIHPNIINSPQAIFFPLSTTFCLYLTHPHSECVVPVQKDLTPRPHCSCSGNVSLLLCILSTSNYTESAFMQYEGRGPFCVYVGYASQGCLEILTTNKLQRQSHKTFFFILKTSETRQKGTGEHLEHLKMNKQVVSLDSRH